MDRTTSYAFDANEEEFHEDLLQRSSSANCMILISGYESDLYLDMLNQANGWKMIQLKTTTRGTKGKDSSRVEVLWMNEQFQEGVRLNRSRVSLNAKRN
jgi:hypothetical protein